ncbi:hypothetical protein V8C35DRAFT_175503 [Trichoderma chlorosporum]
MSSSEKQQNQAPGEQHFPPPPPGPPPQQLQQQQQDHQVQPPQTSQYFPPPPPGPPPSQQQQQQQPYPQFSPPPQQQQSQSYQPQDAHQQQDHHLAGQQSGQAQPQLTSQQHFPLPPHGPPLAQGYQPQQQQHQQYQPQQQQQQYQHQQDLSQQQGQQQTYNNPQAQPPQQTSNYSIPAYNPANPVFAPPPSNNLNEPASPSAYQPQAEGQQHQHQQYAPPSPQHAPSDDQGHHKTGWSERLSALGMKAAAPINSIAHKLGSQGFLPETLDKECEKAATILKAFCKKGVYADPAATSVPTSTDPNATETTDRVIDPTKEKPKNRVIVTIPPKVISKAVGLAIFTTLRAGFQVSGATGSGILIARLPDGSWSPPSGIQLHSVGGGFQIGLDIYDCVCVINNREALAAFTNTRVSLGSDLAVVAGPYGAGAAVEFGTSLDSKAAKEDGRRPSSSQGQGQDQHSQQQSLQPPDTADKKSHRRSLSASATKPVFSYVKSRGFYAGIRVDGTVVAERKDANAAFYGQSVSVDQILKGQVPSQGPPGMWPVGAQTLFSVLKGAEAGVLQASSQEQQQPPSSPGHHQHSASQGYYPQQGQGQPAQQHTYPSVPPPPSYANSGPRPIDGDIKYA